MRSFWSDPYLWIHLAGLATLPIWLELCLLAFAVGDPVLPVWLELFLVGGIGIAPILWMQWQRPFDIYSLLAVSLKPEQLTEDQRKLLTLFTAPRNRFLAIGVALLLAIALQKLYFIAPIAASMTPFAGVGRVGALLLAAIAFLGANLFTQVPAAVLSVLFTSESKFVNTLPFAIDQVRESFTLLGLPVNQILPPLIAEPASPPVAVESPPTEPPTTPTTTEQPPAESAAGVSPVGLNSDDLDDVWGTEVAEDNAGSLAPESATVPLSAPEELPDETEELPDEKPDLAAVEVKTEEVKTEEDHSTTEPVGSEPVGSEPVPTETASDSEAAWLDSPVIDDPASAEPPNSL